MSFDLLMAGGSGSWGGSRNIAKPRRRATRKTSKTSDAIPGFPNSFPFSEMLLDGKLKLGKLGVKSRKRPWNHRGLVLIYSSSSVCRPAAEAHGYDPKTSPRGVILGVGELVDVRELTQAEIRSMCRQFNNTTTAGMRKIMATPGRQYVVPYELGYFFRKLKRFKKPVPFAWPSGAVTTTKIPLSVVAKALKDVGVREINGIRF